MWYFFDLVQRLFFFMDRCEGMINEICNNDIEGIKGIVFFFMLFLVLSSEFMISCISNPTGTN